MHGTTWSSTAVHLPSTTWMCLCARDHFICPGECHLKQTSITNIMVFFSVAILNAIHTVICFCKQALCKHHDLCEWGPRWGWYRSHNCSFSLLIDRNQMGKCMWSTRWWGGTMWRSPPISSRWWSWRSRGERWSCARMWCPTHLWITRFLWSASWCPSRALREPQDCSLYPTLWRGQTACWLSLLEANESGQLCVVWWVWFIRAHCSKNVRIENKHFHWTVLTRFTLFLSLLSFLSAEHNHGHSALCRVMTILSKVYMWLHQTHLLYQCSAYLALN